MSISGINSVQSPLAALQTARAEAQKPTSGPDFSERVKGALDDLHASQAEARQSATDFELGTETDLAKVMVNQQVASLSMQLTLQVRNKALTAYRDIMNMPV
ncbi:MAG: flagellar hook-basal body complex protein FliE [Rhodobacteraceae bacterium]|nr:flagellar hook-basal body complex protein FliE [Paracoccaceae bacterium]